MHRGRYRPPHLTRSKYLDTDSYVAKYLDKLRPLASLPQVFDDERVRPVCWLDEQLPWRRSSAGR